MYSLERTAVSNFKIEKGVTLEELEKNQNNEKFLDSKIFSMETIFKDLSKINLNIKEKDLFLNGTKILCDVKDGVYNIYSKEYVGLGIVKNGLLKRDVCEKLL